MYGDKTQPKMLSIKGPKGQVIPNSKINFEYYITKEQFQELYFKNKMTYKEIMKVIDYPHDESTFSRNVRSLGWKKSKGARPKYTVDETFFDSWNKKSAWVFGLLLTDGHINYKSIDLTLQDKDIDVLEKMKEAMKFTGGIYEREGHNTLRIYNRNLVSAIYKIGIPETDKTFSCEFPEIPKEYMWDFIRGVFEGDGSVSISNGALNVEICGASEKFMTGVYEFLKSEGIDVRLYEPPNRPTDFYVVAPRNMENMLKMLREMYKDAPEEIRMNRKYDLYVEFVRDFYDRRRLCSESKALINQARQTFLKEAV